MIYDYRNLLIESQNAISPNVTFFTKYYYDEAGNRIRQWTYHSTNSGGTDAGDSWSTDNNEYYVRDVTGKEIAVYNGSNLSEWNVYGIDNIGKINNNRARNFYIKDHLGSIRAVINESNNIVTYADYDPWGFYLRGGGNRYGFTSKEKDKDFVNNYNYFGARYYDARIGRWTSTDWQLNKAPGWTPYRAFLDNPLKYIDPKGDFEFPEILWNTYPKLKAFLENEVQKVADDKKTMDALVSVTGRSYEQVKEGLKWRQGPKIWIKELGKDEMRNERLGHYIKETNEIEIDINYVQKFEETIGEESDVYKFLVQVIILHEGAHAGADQTGDAANWGEPGLRFEKAAYGGAVHDFNAAATVLNNRNIESNDPKRYSKKQKKKIITYENFKIKDYFFITSCYYKFTV